MERQLFDSGPCEDLSITEPGANGAPELLREQKPIDLSNYWQNSDGSIRKELLEKARQIRRGQY